MDGLNDKTKVNIALAANDPYFPGLLVTAYSMAKFASKDAVLHFHILDGGLSSGNIEFLRAALERVRNDTLISVLPVDESLFDGFQSWKGNKLAFARLLLPNLLKTEKHIIYCDVDFLWQRDILDFWNLRRDDASLVAVHDYATDTLDSEEEWFGRNGIEFNRARYFCSGLCLLNLEYFRENDLIGRCAAFLSAHKDTNFVDQTALNAVAGDSSVLADPQWMRFSFDLTGEDYQKGVVIHYPGLVPWKAEGFKRIFSEMIWLMPHPTKHWYRFYAEISRTSLKGAVLRLLGWRVAFRLFIVNRLLTRPPCVWFLRLMRAVGIHRMGISFFLESVEG